MPSPAGIARAILDGFDNHYRRFRYVAQQAKALYENGQWRAIRERARERIDFYDQRVQEAVVIIEREFDLDSLTDDERDALWKAVKQSFVALLADHRQPECAETFFNSVCTKLLHRDYFRNTFIFVRPGVATEYMDSDPPSYRSYYPASDGLKNVLRRIIIDFGLACPWADVERDIQRVVRAVIDAHRVGAAFPRPWHTEPDFQIQVLSNLFFRNKGAYIVGRVINGSRITPIAVPILRNSKGAVYIDTILFTSDQLAVLFSFARAYFLVDMEAPAAYADFLRSILPGKPASEIYTSVGLAKQGKTLFYRDFLHHLKHQRSICYCSRNQRPGDDGVHAAVVSLLFKLIKDVIPHPKETDRDQVMAKYQLVKMHDRAGRMADTWEYSQVTLPRSRFSPALLRELLSDCASIVEVRDETVLIDHVYIERRMTPLNIYLTHATDAELEHAVLEYGNAIKELAAANIFPGDMLYKNFGVTRLDRVVFYDYDEIEYMTACEFRQVPQAQTPEDEMSSEVWYSVGARDMFPEKWGAFLLGDDRIRAAFLKHHSDLLTPDFWNARKQRIQSGKMENVFPYSRSLRFKARFPTRYASKSDNARSFRN